MNIRKNIDYSELFKGIDDVFTAKLAQMETFREIGRLIGERPEKGAAVSAAEYVKQAHPDVTGFSSRNTRRMREFYLSYKDDPAAMSAAMEIGWTQNVVILEADLAPEERMWYLCAVRRFGWSKAALAAKIAERANEQIDLDNEGEVCYTGSVETEEDAHDESALCVSREHLPEPDGGVCDEGHGGESGEIEGASDRVRGDEHGGDRESRISAGAPETRRAWHRMCRKEGAPDARGGLRAVRSADRDGSGEPAQYAPDLRRRPGGKDPPPAGLHGPPRRCRRPVVHGRLRRDVA